MSTNKIFWAIGDFMNDVAFIPLENIGNIFNYSCIVLGFVGKFYWLNKKKKFTEQAKNDPNQLK